MLALSFELALCLKGSGFGRKCLLAVAVWSRTLPDRVDTPKLEQASQTQALTEGLANVPNPG
jgi:hypothetical protein